MKKAILTFGAALVVFLAVLVWQFPAGWARDFLPKNVACADFAGTLWSGQCMGLVLNGSAVGDLTWNLSPWRAIAGKAVGNVAVTRADLAMTSDIALSFAGNGTLSNFKARLPLDPAVLPQLPAYLRGDVTADFAKIVIASRWPAELVGTLNVRELRRLDGAQFRLGDYDLNFDGAVAPDGSLIGQLQDRGGPLAVRGTLKLTREPGYEVSGLVGARAEAPQQLRQQLEFLGPPNSSGEREFSLAGSF
jgi:general secretion pathway protein N